MPTRRVFIHDPSSLLMPLYILGALLLIGFALLAMASKKTR